MTADADGDDLTIENNGRVGISLLSPDSQSSQLIYGSPSDSRGAQFQWLYSSHLFTIGTLDPAGGQLRFNIANDTEAVRINSSGNMGIGTTTPSVKLDVVGDLKITGTAFKPGGGSWTATSDARVKTDIEGIGGALDVIGRLRAVRFRYSPEYRAGVPGLGDRYFYNFIAQEYRRVFPDDVAVGPDGYLTVDTSAVTPYLVEAVQEMVDLIRTQEEQLAAQQRELEVQQERSEAQQRQIDELRALVDSLMRRERGR